MEEFMNTYDEIHAVWYGFSDSLAWARHPTDTCPEECLKEPHYYRFGWFVGKIMQAGIYFVIGALLYKIVGIV